MITNEYRDEGVIVAPVNGEKSRYSVGPFVLFPQKVFNLERVNPR